MAPHCRPTVSVVILAIDSVGLQGGPTANVSQKYGMAFWPASRAKLPADVGRQCRSHICTHASRPNIVGQQFWPTVMGHVA